MSALDCLKYYLIASDGRCIYSFREDDSNRKELFGGAMMAVKDVFGYMDFRPFLNMIITYRTTTGEKKHFIFVKGKVCYGLMFLDKDIYSQQLLIDVNKFLLSAFENKYKERIDNFISSGTPTGNLDDFIMNNLNLLREQERNAYLKAIVSDSMTRVKKERCMGLMLKLTEASRKYSCDFENLKKVNDQFEAEIVKMAGEERSKTFNKIIKKVNQKYIYLWDFFGVKLIQPEVADEGY